MKTLMLLLILTLLSCKKEVRTDVPVTTPTIIINDVKNNAQWLQGRPFCYDDLNTVFIKSIEKAC